MAITRQISAASKTSNFRHGTKSLIFILNRLFYSYRNLNRKKVQVQFRRQAHIPPNKKKMVHYSFHFIHRKQKRNCKPDLATAKEIRAWDTPKIPCSPSSFFGLYSSAICLHTLLTSAKLNRGNRGNRNNMVESIRWTKCNYKLVYIKC